MVDILATYLNINNILNRKYLSQDVINAAIIIINNLDKSNTMNIINCKVKSTDLHLVLSRLSDDAVFIASLNDSLSQYKDKLMIFKDKIISNENYYLRYNQPFRREACWLNSVFCALMNSPTPFTASVGGAASLLAKTTGYTYYVEIGALVCLAVLLLFMFYNYKIQDSAARHVGDELDIEAIITVAKLRVDLYDYFYSLKKIVFTSDKFIDCIKYLSQKDNTPLIHFLNELKNTPIIEFKNCTYEKYNSSFVMFIYGEYKFKDEDIRFLDEVHRSYKSFHWPNNSSNIAYLPICRNRTVNEQE